MAPKKVSFSADASVIARLGRELVGKQETALTELIKNAYDADATQVDVVLIGQPPAALEIRDNGSGMTSDELVNGFLRIASTGKIDRPRSDKYRRVRAGRKGIGRFSSERLGTSLVLSTKSRGSAGLRLQVNWNEFKPGAQLSDVKAELEQTDLKRVGTTLRIDGLRDSWSEDQFRRCLQNVMGLLQPFPIARVAGDRRADPGFQVRFLREGELFEDTTISDLQSEVLSLAHAIIEVRVNDKGVAEWRITKNRFGATRSWKQIHHDAGDKKPRPYEYLRNLAAKAHYFILQGAGVLSARVRQLLSERGGIRIYRNGFRVVPYGDPDDDWLGLDFIYSRRAETLAPIANRNFFGVVELDDLNGDRFEERTSREGLIDNPEFRELQSLLSSVLITAINAIAADRGRVGAASERKTKPRDRAAGEVRKRVIDLIEKVEGAGDDSAPAEIRQELEHIEQDLRDVEADASAHVQEVEMLRFLASIGMASAEFTHEIRVTFQSFGLDMDRVLAFVGGATRDQNLKKTIARVDSARRRIEAFTGYFNDTMASRNLRERSSVSLKKVVVDFVQGMNSIVVPQRISIEVAAPEMDPLFAVPMHEAELSSILLNLLTNSIKAIKRGGGDRKILIEAGRQSSQKLVIRFSDTGDGVEQSLKSRIFDAFVTIQDAPPSFSPERRFAVGTGIGLWIVKQIVENFGGQIGVSEPPSGYSTCFEVVIPAEGAGRG
ncbi:sensor histidine kinase [Bradyrhizobium sp. HKCCYLS3013]|uniref:sensor histidine kinase n=1 Tax=Bradyrhizobium sp. HKCCYLS3013 TaxID=3420735 RepID=UPI003EC02DFA